MILSSFQWRIKKNSTFSHGSNNLKRWRTNIKCYKNNHNNWNKGNAEQRERACASTKHTVKLLQKFRTKTEQQHFYMIFRIWNSMESLCFVSFWITKERARGFWAAWNAEQFNKIIYETKKSLDYVCSQFITITGE